MIDAVVIEQATATCLKLRRKPYRMGFRDREFIFQQAERTGRGGDDPETSIISELTCSEPSFSVAMPNSRKQSRNGGPEPTVNTPPGHSRRHLAGLVAVACLLAAALAKFSGGLEQLSGSASTSGFLVASLVRIGLVFGAIWFAWDSLKRPARWLPPGLAVLGVVAIIAVAAQPKLIIAALPLFGVVAVLTSVLRFFRREP